MRAERSDGFDARTALKCVADELDCAERRGEPNDAPEGVCYVRLSDTLARAISTTIRQVLEEGFVRP